ncbi:MAG: carbohydrate kinase family protein [Chloroflexota bacterium]|nr:carbohydrate kinase family protein [Chloroflexota bacterium]
MQNILSAGFVCGDLVLRPVDKLPPTGGNRFVDDARLTIGGCAANAAVAFARLLRPVGGSSALLGRVGDDALGQSLIDQLTQTEVNTSYLQSTPGVATAINTALVSSTGERSFYVFPGACDHLFADDLSDERLSRFDHLHLAAIGALPNLAGKTAADVARRARALGLTVSLDVTLNPPRDIAADVRPILPFVDLFLPNLTEAQAILEKTALDDLLDQALADGVGLVGIKQGEAGCTLATEKERLSQPAFDVPTLDTCGAGDSWSATVVYGWKEGWSLNAMARIANAAGALCSAIPGSTLGLTDAKTLRYFAARTRLR